MSPVIVQIDFPFHGPWGDQLAQEYGRAAAQIAEAPGLIWKIWTENSTQNVAGGIYLFIDRDHARRFLDDHRRELIDNGLTGIRALILDTNTTLTALNGGPLDAGTLTDPPVEQSAPTAPQQ
ncbi:putative monooxygenase YdhR [Austwickia sp. TVS 96-490-7B]|uniref:YdhR family protein n=1 Tax=Austwickia sp. TVS 96-490-7B TaxID=2830843 RepID=UPI001C5A2E90|nr:YdhR family protein [Austwickia sp. TVS 96-490-7B]MBW3085177.1 putative monooxygenase YdhR [Austwickia sp. TVS 96-490-7B]